MKDIPLLQLEGLGKYIRTDSIDRQLLFRDVSARIYSTSLIALLGVSGQGKSTLLRVISLLDQADEGMMSFKGQSCKEVEPQQWRSKIAYVAQHAVMLEGTVEDNLKMVSFLRRESFDSGLARELMDKAGLSRMEWSKKAADLSGGEKQRVALIRSLLLQPDILLLDEITASLDTQSKHAVEQLLLEWHRSYGTPMIWVTHDLEQARAMSNQIWFMADHTLLEAAPTSAFFVRPATAQGRKFLNIPEETEV